MLYKTNKKIIKGKKAQKRSRPKNKKEKIRRYGRLMKKLIPVNKEKTNDNEHKNRK